MGKRVHPKTQDSLPMRFFLNHWFETLLDFPNIAPEVQQNAASAFRRAVLRHRKGIPSPQARWGWKNPRNMWLIPFYASVYPQLKFVHVIRDGRDMSLSNNLFLLKSHGKVLVGSNWSANPAAAQLEAWARGNLRAAEAERYCAPGNYLRLRYEDLCLSPHVTARRLFDFLGASESSIDEALREVRPSAGIGRWRSGQADGTIAALSPAAETALRRFGYLLS
ncbi:MAG TPA: sulfotransferase [Candidatus Acidoferrales bacterium]|nr:sulfotransferase [Candidatus Acidoferrales bacterium]